MGIDSQIQSKLLSVRTNVKEEESTDICQRPVDLCGIVRMNLHEGLRNRRIRVTREYRSREVPGSSY